MADDNIFVGPHNGIVAFESLTIGVRSFVGKGKAIHMGLSNPTGPILEKFKCIMRDVEIDAEGSFVWGLFGYQCDWELIDVHFNASMFQGHEHNLYAHGFAKTGAYYENVTMDGCGAECLKHTARPGESRWVQNALIHIKNCTFKNWMNPATSWRGGAGFTAQGSSANILIEGSRYYGGTTMDRARCIMFDDSGYDFYNAINGTPGQGPANGHIIIRNTGGCLNGTSQPWNNKIMNFTTLAQRVPPYVARTLLMENCGFYGGNTLVGLSGPTGDAFFGPAAIRGCNTTEIRDLMAHLGFNVDVESQIAGPTGVIPLSRGIEIPKN